MGIPEKHAKPVKSNSEIQTKLHLEANLYSRRKDFAYFELVFGGQQPFEI